jgi:hypothetical protein
MVIQALPVSFFLLFASYLLLNYLPRRPFSSEQHQQLLEAFLMNASLRKMVDPRAVLALAVCVAIGAATPAISAPVYYDVVLNGPSEQPPNASPGTGTAQVVIDAVAHTLYINLTFGGLLGNTSACHIHAPTLVAFAGTASVATTTPSFAGFPNGVTAGNFVTNLNTLAAGTYNPSYVTANGGTPASAETALFAAIAAGKAYLNVHSSSFPGGEIRGFLRYSPVATEPSTWGKVKALYR